MLLLLFQTVQDTGVSGALSKTLDDATSASTGTVDVVGTTAPTLGNAASDPVSARRDRPHDRRR